MNRERESDTNELKISMRKIKPVNNHHDDADLMNTMKRLLRLMFGSHNRFRYGCVENEQLTFYYVPKILRMQFSVLNKKRPRNLSCCSNKVVLVPLEVQATCPSITGIVYTFERARTR